MLHAHGDVLARYEQCLCITVLLVHTIVNVIVVNRMDNILKYNAKHAWGQEPRGAVVYMVTRLSCKNSSPNGDKTFLFQLQSRNVLDVRIHSVTRLRPGPWDSLWPWQRRVHCLGSTGRWCCVCPTIEHWAIQAVSTKALQSSLLCDHVCRRHLSMTHVENVRSRSVRPTGFIRTPIIVDAIMTNLSLCKASLY